MKNTKLLIALSYKIRNRKDISFYNTFDKQTNAPINLLEEEQLKAFINLFEYSKNNVPYYSVLFRRLKLSKNDFNTLDDLEKIPILTKKDIMDNYHAFIPKNYTKKYFKGSTGGSTGEPLKYRMSAEDYSRGVALLYRGFSYAGYKIGDKMAIIAGGSLVKNEVSFLSKINHIFLNLRKFSSYGIDNNDLENFYFRLKNWQPKFLRGYASSLALFANYCKDNQKELSFKAVFSTAEMLMPHQKSLIESVFNTRVFDNYGLNDGGVSAYENDSRDGLMIDTERGILEIVEDGSQQNTFNKNGKIIATSLYNYAFPFIRYDTGDYGTQVKEDNLRKKLINLRGRATDYIILNGKTIGSPVLTVLMGKIDAIKYQIVQKKDSSLEIRILKGKNFDHSQENFIKKSLISNIGGNINIIFRYTHDFIPSENKHKFIIRE